MFVRGIKKSIIYIFSVLICAWLICVYSFADTASTARSASFASGSGTKAEPFVIETAEQFASFALSVNSGNDYAQQYVVLASDIILNNTTSDSWTEQAEPFQPIGSKEHPFAGSFDGAGYTVIGVYVNDASADYAGLFGYSNGLIQNLSLSESYVSGGRYTGGICGYGHAGMIINCTSSAEISGSADGSGYTGGICGYKKDGAVINCNNSGNINGTNNVGGICGTARDTVYGCTNRGTVTGTGRYVGGICGWSFYSINGCVNEGAVLGKSFTGGVCGVNYGNITESCSTKGITGLAYTGGVCGYSIYKAKITNSYNTGVVSGTGYVGGVCGMSYEHITDCYNIGAVYGEKNTGGICGGGRDVSECYNAGAVAGKSNIGGISGENYSSAIRICYNIGTVSGTEYTGGICGYNYSLIIDCFNTGEINGGVNSGGITGRNDGGGIATCYNVGKVSGKYFAGSVIGSASSDGVVQNCYYLENTASDEAKTVQQGTGWGVSGVSAEDNALHTAVLSAGDMKLAESFDGFDLSSVWTAKGDSYYPYPELRAITFVSGVKLDKTELRLTRQGQTAQLLALVPPNPALDTSAVWSSADSSVASVDQNGVVTAVGSGTAEIKVALEGGSLWDVCTVTVTVPTISVVSAAGRPGGTVRVDIAIENNPGFDAVELKFILDSPDLVFEKLESSLQGISIDENGVISWSGSQKYQEDGSLATLVYRVSDPASDSDVTAKVQVISCTDSDLEGEIVCKTADGTVSVSNYSRGDINRDDKVDVQDVVRLLDHINGSDVMADTRFRDINQDGSVNVQDVIRLLGHVNGSYPFEEDSSGGAQQ